MRERDFKEWDDFLFAPQASFFASKLKKTITKKQSSIANKCVLFAFPKIRVYKSGADEWGSFIVISTITSIES